MRQRNDKAIPLFFSATSATGDRAAQTNLTNALGEMNILFQNGQSYGAAWQPAPTLAASVPEFTWSQAGACTTTSPDTCVSEYPVDVIGPGGGRGVILSSLSSDHGVLVRRRLGSSSINQEIQ